MTKFMLAAVSAIALGAAPAQAQLLGECRRRAQRHAERHPRQPTAPVDRQHGQRRWQRR